MVEHCHEPQCPSPIIYRLLSPLMKGRENVGVPPWLSNIIRGSSLSSANISCCPTRATLAAWFQKVIIWLAILEPLAVDRMAVPIVQFLGVKRSPIPAMLSFSLHPVDQLFSALFSSSAQIPNFGWGMACANRFSCVLFLAWFCTISSNEMISDSVIISFRVGWILSPPLLPNWWSAWSLGGFVQATEQARQLCTCAIRSGLMHSAQQAAVKYLWTTGYVKYNAVLLPHFQ